MYRLSLMLFAILWLSQIQAQQAVQIEMTPYDLFIEPEGGGNVVGQFNVPAAVLTGSLDVVSRMSSNVKTQAKQKPMRISSPLVVKRAGKCYQLGCANNCGRCTMVWWDRNGDGKVQAKKELRCACRDSQKQCEIKGRKDSCE